MIQQTDRIKKKVLLRPSRESVWLAISDAKQFGSWFGIDFDGAFIAGVRLTGRIAPTEVDAEVAKAQAPHAGKAFEFMIDRIEPMRLFSFRWHPFAVDPAVDYTKEPVTLVVFEIEEATDGTMLTVTESGFDQIPLARRAEAFTANDQGWAAQMKLIEKYLSSQP